MLEISVLILVLVALEGHFHQIICLYPSVIQPFRLFRNCQLLNVRPAEVRSFLHGQLPPEKTQDIRDQILKIGIPL